MARFLGIVGFAPTGTFVDDVWTANVVERPYKGEVLEATSSIEPSDKVNDDIRLQNRIRFVGDSYALENFSVIRYVLWHSARWTVISVSVERPELTLSLGGVYDGVVP
jgi:hypothetical protein